MRIGRERLTGRSEAGGSVLGPPLRPFAACCSGLGVVAAPPCSEFKELLTLEPGVEVCTAPFSLMFPPPPRPPAAPLFEELTEIWEPATFAFASFADWALSAFFLLLKSENAIVAPQRYVQAVVCLSVRPRQHPGPGPVLVCLLRSVAVDAVGLFVVAAVRCSRCFVGRGRYGTVWYGSVRSLCCVLSAS